ncbi:unnamed protein product [Gongylonema pulchrum]|uniref:Envelope stress response membrane protein PspB n=1 Tax=Gongylonema pulchrum TaxID=637853 RepID=A0A183DD76_9BILA|nr:unnamed protein product [Gongylonema pulchrum]
MRIIIAVMTLLLLLLLAVMPWGLRSQEQLELPDAAMTKRLISSIPKISQLIRDELEGKRDAIRQVALENS